MGFGARLLLTAIVVETSDEWETGRAYFSDHSQP
jgi:hypothetical protein